MRKSDELACEHSCLNRANDDETIFVLLGRDPAAPVAVRAWIEERIRLGKNMPNDAKILGAHECIREMMLDHMEQIHER
jgi:hypothetical protein